MPPDTCIYDCHSYERACRTEYSLMNSTLHLHVTRFMSEYMERCIKCKSAGMTCKCNPFRNTYSYNPLMQRTKGLNPIRREIVDRIDEFLRVRVLLNSRPLPLETSLFPLGNRWAAMARTKTNTRMSLSTRTPFARTYHLHSTCYPIENPHPSVRPWSGSRTRFLMWARVIVDIWMGQSETYTFACEQCQFEQVVAEWFKALVMSIRDKNI